MKLSEQIKENLNQLSATNSEAQITPKSYDDENLTPEEEAEWLRRGREAKHDERVKQEYWNKIKAQRLWEVPNAAELLENLKRTKSQTGKPFQVTEWNDRIITALCLYFSKNKAFEALDESYSLDKGIMLSGPPGVGKTHLMDFFAKNAHASYLLPTCKALAAKHAIGWKRDDIPAIEYYSGLIKSPEGHPFNQDWLGCCFGDLGTEEISNNYGNKRNVMEEIIFNRYETKLPFKFTHITTNLTPSMISEMYGERMRDRLKEMCNQLVFVDGKSFR